MKAAKKERNECGFGFGFMGPNIPVGNLGPLQCEEIGVYCGSQENGHS